MKDILDYSLLAHNTFGIDARCHRFLEFATVEEAQQVSDILKQTDLPFIIIGEGSNLLLTRDYEGIVVHSAIHGSRVVVSRYLLAIKPTWPFSVVPRSHLYSLFTTSTTLLT